MTEKRKILIRFLNSIGIWRDTIIMIGEEIKEDQIDELMEYLIQKHESGTEATNEEVTKALLIFLRRSGKI